MTLLRNLMIALAIGIVPFLLGSCANNVTVEQPQAQHIDEPFETFYNRFKNDGQFKYERTVFPIKATIFHTDTAEQSDVTVVETWNKQEVQSGAKFLFVNENIVRSEGYSHQIMRNGANFYKVEIGKINSEPACGYIFKKTDGGWYLVEFMNYWGSSSNP